MVVKFVKNREGDMVPFDLERIRLAVEKAYMATGLVAENTDDLVVNIVDCLESLHEECTVVGLEHIQDVVEKQLMKVGAYDVTKQYILYRQKHNEKRAQERQDIKDKFEHHQLKVTKDDGSREFFDIEKVRKTFLQVNHGYENLCPFSDLEDGLVNYLVDRIKTADIMKMMVKVAIDLISVDNIHRQFIAGRLLTSDLYKQSSRQRNISVQELYSPQSFLSLVQEYVTDKLYYQGFLDAYSEEDFLEAGRHIVADRDMDYGYTSLLMYKKRYLLNPNGIIKELPQHMYMAVAMFLAVPEKKEERLAKALEFYDVISTQKLSLATPTLMNARRKFHQLSSCFVLTSDDDLRGIYHTIENISQISKFGGGVGVYWGKVRSKGGSIRGVKGVSGGVVPWLRVVNDTAIAVNQLGARAGAVSVTLDLRHRDIYDYLSMQTETGDMRRKCFDIFPAVSIPDLFMKRVLSGGEWTLFDPKEVFDTTGQKMEDLWGDDFERFYTECEQNENIFLKKTIDAKEIFKTFLKVVVETGMPYVFFRDTVNRLNPNKHKGMVYSSQLCTEIAQNMSAPEFIEEVDENGNIVIKYKPGDAVVCNLASINMGKVFSSQEIQNVLPVSMNILDNVIEMNFFPFKESELTSQKYRSVGLGFLGLAEYLATHGLSYESEEARQNVDKLFEEYAYWTLQGGIDMAKKRGKYPLFDGSDWAKGLVMGKDKTWFAEHGKTDLDWNSLIDELQEHGTRFAYHMSPAPNTSTANVVGTTAGLLPIYKKYYVYTDAVAPSVNVAPKLSQENFWYYKEYVHMRMPEVIKMIATVQKWIDQTISFEWIINPANTSPKDLFDYYVQAWQEGIKTVYYVRSMTLDVKECVSCSG